MYDNYRLCLVGPEDVLNAEIMNALVEVSENNDIICFINLLLCLQLLF